jgi:hypothetical protein
VTGCYIHNPFPYEDGGNAGGGSDYGIDLTYYTSSTLIENNIALHCRHSFILEQAAGQDNVIAYNYGKDNINQNFFTTDYQEDTDYHGGEPRFNLFEGNVLPIIRVDAVEGATKYDTYFRNYVTRDGIPTVTVAVNALDIQRGNYYDYFVDNVYAKTNANSVGQPIYRIGSWEDTWPYDQSVYTNNTWFGNLDLSTGQTDRSANGNIYWTNSFSHVFPNSLYYASRPSWYSNNLSWPPFGSDIAGHTNLIPAQVRATAIAGFASPPSDSFGLTLGSSAGGTAKSPGNLSYFNSAMVGLVATPDSSHVFSHWSGYPVANSNSPSTYLIMPASNVAITANFVAIGKQPPPSSPPSPPSQLQIKQP